MTLVLGYHGSRPYATGRFVPPTTLPANSFTLSGAWAIGQEAITAGQGAGITLSFHAADVYLDVGGTGTLTVSSGGTGTCHSSTSRTGSANWRPSSRINGEDPAYREEMGPQRVPDPPGKPDPPGYFPVRHLSMHLGSRWQHSGRRHPRARIAARGK